MVQAIFESGAYEEPEIGFRLQLDGKWSAAEFAELLEHLSFLNDVARLKYDDALGPQGSRFLYIIDWMEVDARYHLRRFSNLEFDLEEESAYIRRQVRSRANEISPEYRDDLKIIRISLASPGNLDLAGFGKIAKEVRLFIEGILDRFSEDRKIETELKRQKLVAAKIANANKILELGARVDMPQADRQAIVREVLNTDRFIETKLIDGKITNVERLSS